MPDYINIRTAQNVNISYKLAGLGNRVVAKVLDLIIITGYMLAALFLVVGVTDLASAISSRVLISILSIPAMLYSLLFELFNNGQTPGKSIMRSRVVSLDGSPLRISQILTRWLLLLVDLWILFGLAGLLSIILGDRQQRLGDMAAATIIISLRDDSNLANTSYQKTDINYVPSYPQTSLLSEQDIRILKSVLADRSDNKYKNITSAADKMQDIMGVIKRQSSENFLKTIVLDYNHYHQNR